VADTPVGRRVPVVVLRDGKRVTVSVTLGLRDQNVLASLNNAPPETQSRELGGLRVRELTAEEKAEAEVKSGVLVLEVQPGSAAEEAGIAENDVIEEIGGKPVTDAAAFTRLLGDAKSRGKRAVLLVRRGNNTQFVPLTVTE
jgi:serine protease Do